MAGRDFEVVEHWFLRGKWDWQCWVNCIGWSHTRHVLNVLCLWIMALTEPQNDFFNHQNDRFLTLFLLCSWMLFLDQVITIYEWNWKKKSHFIHELIKGRLLYPRWPSIVWTILNEIIIWLFLFFLLLLRLSCAKIWWVETFKCDKKQSSKHQNGSNSYLRSVQIYQKI